MGWRTTGTRLQRTWETNELNGTPWDGTSFLGRNHCHWENCRNYLQISNTWTLENNSNNNNNKTVNKHTKKVFAQQIALTVFEFVTISLFLSPWRGHKKRQHQLCMKNITACQIDPSRCTSDAIRCHHPVTYQMLATLWCHFKEPEVLWKPHWCFFFHSGFVGLMHFFLLGVLAGGHCCHEYVIFFSFWILFPKMLVVDLDYAVS